MFCDYCLELVKEMAKEKFLELRPNMNILKVINSSHSLNACLLMVEYTDQNNGHRMDYQEIKDIFHHCVYCGKKI